MKIINQSTVLLFFWIFLLGCLSCEEPMPPKENIKLDDPAKVETNQSQSVAVLKIKRENYVDKRLWFGKIVIKNKVDYYAKTSGIIKEWNIHTGKKLKTGEVAVQLENTPLEIEKAKLSLEKKKAWFEVNDLIIRNEGIKDDLNSIPKASKEGILLQTNWYDLEYKEKELEYKKSLLKISISKDGWVSQEKSMKGVFVNQGQALFSFLPSSSVFVELNIPQIEWEEINTNQTFTIGSKNNAWQTRAKFQFTDTELSETGLLRIYLKPNSLPFSVFTNGYNVNVILKKKLKNAILIPSESIVERDGYQTVFTVNEAEDKAVFNFVKAVLINDSTYLVKEGIKEEDLIITKGNELLEHDSPVQIINE